MKTSFLLFILLIPSCFLAQHVEIQGKAKISVMDTANTEGNLVVRKPNGELATRQVSSLSMPPSEPDTARTFGTDLQLANTICQCGGMVPALVQSALTHGYTLTDLIGFGASLEDLLNAGITLDDLIEDGFTILELFEEGFTIQQFFAAGLTPMELYDEGIPYLELIGETYQGGLLYYVDTVSGTGLIAAFSDLPGGYSWGCEGTNVPGAQGWNIGTGLQNTLDIDAGCSTPGIAAEVCLNHASNGYSDWFLPSGEELWTMHISIGRGATGEHFNLANMVDGNYYWSSSESNALDAHILCLYIDPIWGCPEYAMWGALKSWALSVRPIRKF